MEQTPSLGARKYKRALLCEFLLISIVPVVLLWTKVFSPAAIFIVLSTVFITVFCIVVWRINKNVWTWKEIGFRTDNITKQSLLHYVIATMSGAIALCLAWTYTSNMIGFPMQTVLLYSLIGSMFQEFLYRSYLMRLGKELFIHQQVNFVVNVVLFTGMHFFYDKNLITMMLIFCGGVLFTGLYQRYPNFYLISSAHIVLNLVAVMTGMFQ